MEAWVEVLREFGISAVMILAMGIFIWNLWKQSVERENKLIGVNEQAIATLAKYADRLTVIEQDIKDIKDDMTTIMAKDGTQ